ncbi:hypothetical protein [Rhizobium laguerreae]|nr:hypothetical protein [Rhizobium laguerreae]
MKSQDIVILLKLVSLQEQEEHREDEWLQLDRKAAIPTLCAIWRHRWG